MPFTSSNWNVTSNTVVSNSFDGGLVLALVLIAFAMIILIAIMTSLERYAWLMNHIGKWVSSLKYTAFGIGISACGYGLYLGCQFIAAAGSGIDPIWIVEAIGVYIVLTAIGWAGEKTVRKLGQMHTAYAESKKGDEVTAGTSGREPSA